MKITNKHSLPESVLNALHRPTYNKGHANLSVTELLTSPRIVQLKRKHWDEIEQDASDMVWQLFGSAVHHILEHGKQSNHIIEERLFMEFSGWVLSGAIDLQTVEKNGVNVSDYKTTSAWVVQNEKPEWDEQLNVYAYLIEKVKKVPVLSLSIIAIIRDWSSREASLKPDYPQAPIVTIPIPLWPIEQQENFISNKLAAHANAQFEVETDGDLPLCTSTDMWEKPDVWAVKKEGGVRAKSLHASKDEAQQACPKGYVVEHRPGERTRCKSYCQVSKFCTQYQTYLEKTNDPSE